MDEMIERCVELMGQMSPMMGWMPGMGMGGGMPMILMWGWMALGWALVLALLVAVVAAGVWIARCLGKEQTT